ncbi:MAG: uroporphyrinogen-III C-methyltransferase [Hydrogenothermaceae bacterium]
MGKVFLIGCGPGDYELLTIKAYKTLQNLDIALVDHLITDEILKVLPSKTKILYVGKQKGKLSVKQEDINKILLEFAKSGLKIGRLKSGDPYIFGRGGEEYLFLLQNGIEVEVIPGVSSSTAGPLYADIPIVMRDYSSGFSVVSAHLSGNRFNKNWIPLLKLRNHTVVVLMGLSRVKDILEEARSQGIDLRIPTAIVSNVSRSDQKVVIGTLEDIEKLASVSQKPAVIIFGEVVNLHKKIKSYKNVTLDVGELIWKK